MRPATVTAGQPFGRGVVTVPDAGRDGRGRRVARLLCDPGAGGCGTVYEAQIRLLRRGDTRSCGCLARENSAALAGSLNTTHGLSGHPLRPTWYEMIRRCENPNASNYRYYGGRVPPVTVYGPWHDLARFITDIEAEIGPHPEGFTPAGRALWTLNRKDNATGYQPGNVEWADWFAQASNRDLNGMTAAERASQRQRVLQLWSGGLNCQPIADALDVSYSTVWHIIDRATGGSDHAQR